MRKKVFFSFFFLSVDFAVWIASLNKMCFWHQFMPKIVHFMVFYLIFSPEETVGSARQVPLAPLQFAFQKAAEDSVFPHDVQN